ncbi:MAG: hypothetical protein IJ788_00840 [Oscillospiraceae bacterium]|nr:hypothetical protein [Oscillospiraceae bacterium]
MNLNPNFLLLIPTIVIYFVWYRAAELLALRFTLRKREKAKRMKIILSVWWKIAIVNIVIYILFRAFNTFAATRVGEIFTAYSEKYDTSSVEWLIGFADGAIKNPLSHPTCAVFELILIFFAAVLSYRFTKRILDRSHEVTLMEAKNAALAVSILSAPWTFLLPTLYL